MFVPGSTYTFSEYTAPLHEPFIAFHLTCQEDTTTEVWRVEEIYINDEQFDTLADLRITSGGIYSAYNREPSRDVVPDAFEYAFHRGESIIARTIFVPPISGSWTFVFQSINAMIESKMKVFIPSTGC